MATYTPAKRGVAFVIYIDMVDQSNPLVFKTNPTIAAGDWKVSKDGGAYANLATLPVVEPAGSSTVKVALSGTEMDADNVHVLGVDASGDETCSVSLNIQPVANQNDDIAAAIAALNNLSAADVNAEVDTAISDAGLATAASLAAVAADVAPIRTGTLAAGAVGGVSLDSGASSVDDYYNDMWLWIVSGTGAGQVRMIYDYTGSTRVAVVAKAFVTAPSSDSVYKILPASYIGAVMVLAANSVNASALATDAVTEIQSGLATAAALQTVDTNVGTLVSSVTTKEAIADAVLGRGVSNVEDTADTTSLAALILAALESSVSGTTWTIRKTDGETFVTKTVTTDDAADPITGVT